MSKLLVVDDESIICHSFRRVFVRPGLEVLTAGTVAEGWRSVQDEEPDVIVVDLQLPDGSGLDLFDRIRGADPRRPVIIITAHGTTQTAIEAMKRGAFEYLLKPLDLEQTNRLLERALEAARLMREPAQLPDDPVPDRIIGRTPAIQEMCKQIGRVAPQDVAVLISGESGTGKELVARAIYQHSKRADKPFLAINCAAIPETLVESELFGHEPGAFTGAERRRIGKFEQCNDGTLLLDEIGDMPAAAQAKILRLIQEQRFERVGGSQTIETRVRILAATNQDLEQLIAAGRFRRDLFYRLQEVAIRVPPLRDRKDDIPELAQHFLQQFVRESGRDVRSFDAAALQRLREHDWPGNVRELRSAVREAMLRASGQIVLPEFLALADSPSSKSSAEASALWDLASVIEELLRAGETDVYDKVMSRVERELISRVLRHEHGHQGQASERLGIDRKTLRARLRELGITLEKTIADRGDAS